MLCACFCRRKGGKDILRDNWSKELIQYKLLYFLFSHAEIWRENSSGQSNQECRILRCYFRDLLKQRENCFASFWDENAYLIQELCPGRGLCYMNIEGISYSLPINNCFSLPNFCILHLFPNLMRLLSMFWWFWLKYWLPIAMKRRSFFEAV